MARAERLVSEARRALAAGNGDKPERLLTLALELLASADELCASDG
jgi:phage shock protein A